MKVFMIAMSLIFVTTFAASAAGPKMVQSYTSNYISNSDQDRCQAEADHMAANNITGHVWGVIGSFEGVGYGSSPNCNTCTPRSNMRLTGDASAQGRNGKWYRVRSWR
jgi:hypothetical protein